MGGSVFELFLKALDSWPSCCNRRFTPRNASPPVSAIIITPYYRYSETMGTTELISRRGFLTKMAPRPEQEVSVFASQAPVIGAISVKAGLEPFNPAAQKPWDKRRAAHLLRRTSIGVNKSEIDQILSLDPVTAANQIVDEVLNTPRPAPPSWYPSGTNDGEQKKEVKLTWLEDMRISGLREKMAFFWSNHFVTAGKAYNFSSYMFQYLDVLRKHALGNFKDFTHEMGLTPAMLIYLDSIKNKDAGPNENYARELLELFTMGIFNQNGLENYSQNDIAELARAFTGLRIDEANLSYYVDDKRHDFGIKTIFGQTGQFGYDEAVDIIFDLRTSEIAYYVCSRLYRFFVHAVPDTAVVNEMTDIFLANNFEIAPVMRALLASEHFFEDHFIGARYKSPVELLNGLAVEAGLNIDEVGALEIFENCDRLGQKIFDPPNVAGWSGYQSWLSTGTLPLRWEYAGEMINGSGDYPSANLIPLANQMSDPNDPYMLSRDLADFFLPQELDEEEYTILAEVLLDGMPDYEWDIDEPVANSRLRGFMTYLTQLPQFQLI